MWVCALNADPGLIGIRIYFSELLAHLENVNIVLDLSPFEWVPTDPVYHEYTFIHYWRRRYQIEQEAKICPKHMGMLRLRESRKRGVCLIC